MRATTEVILSGDEVENIELRDSDKERVPYRIFYKGEEITDFVQSLNLWDEALEKDTSIELNLAFREKEVLETLIENKSDSNE